MIYYKFKHRMLSQKQMIRFVIYSSSFLYHGIFVTKPGRISGRITGDESNLRISVSLSVSRSRFPQLGTSRVSPPSGLVGSSLQLEQPGRRASLLFLIPHRKSSLQPGLRKALLRLRPGRSGGGGRWEPSYPRPTCLLVPAPAPPACPPG